MTHPRILRTLLALVAVAAACVDPATPAAVDTARPTPPDTTPRAPARQPRLVVETNGIVTAAAGVALGDTARLRAYVVDTLGVRTPAAAVAFTVADGARLAVDSAGNAVGTDAGTTVVRATAGALRDSVVVTVRGFYVQLDTAAMYVGGERVLAGRRYFANGEPGLLTPATTWSVSDSTVASVVRETDGTLRVTGLRPGHATVTARFLSARATSEIFVEPRPSRRFASVDGGFLTGCALGVDGVAYCWGYGTSGLLVTSRAVDRCETYSVVGRPPVRVRSTIRCGRTPLPVEGTAGLVSLRVGESHACGLDAAGTALCWGSNYYGQLGRGTIGGLEPERPAPVPGRRFRAIFAGNDRTCALAGDDALACWGGNWFGGLGTGDTVSASVPRPVVGDRKWSDVAIGFAHVCGVTTEGAVYCWGRDVYGELGGERGETCDGLACSTVPLPVRLPEPIASLTAGAFFSCALGRSGAAYCWGHSAWVGRGIAPIDDGRAPPARVAGDVRFTQIASDNSGTCALTAAGEAYCWTRNAPARYELVSVPLRSLGLGEAVACGMGRDDYLYCWGTAGAGIIADDSNVQRTPAFVRIAGQP